MTILTDTIGEYTSAAGVTIDGVKLKDSSATASGGIVAPSMKNASNSTTGIQLQNAAGTSILNVDTTNSRVGIGTTAPQGVLHTLAAGGPTTTQIVERSQAGMIDVGYSTLRIKATKPTDMADGFGTFATFSIADDAAVENTIAYIGAVRAGADSTGDVVFQPFIGGSPNERLRIKSNGNVLIGGTAARGTTAGAAALHIFNGTAPVGTLANGVSIYSASGECYIMDAAGNATLSSPHDPETGEWIFYSRNTVTGREVRVNMEQMVAAIEQITGQKFMEVTE